MVEQSLTESAALAKILKQFFEAVPALSAEAVASETRETFAQLQAEIAELQQRVVALETEAVAVQRQLSKTSSKHVSARQSPMVLGPLKAVDLAKRLGLSASAVEIAADGGSTSFQEWSKRRDPASRAWQKLGDLFHPLKD